MTTPTIPGSGRETFYGTQLRPEQTLQLVSAIIAGGQFSSTLARQATNMASVVFPVISSIDEPEWTPELAPIPVLGIDGKPLVVAPSRLSGITMISREAWSDGGLNITAQVQQALRDRFSAVLDRDLLSGSGEGAVPRGLIGQAQQVTGDNLWAAVVTAKAQIAASGGQATHLATSPDVVAAEESRVDEDGRPLWPDGLGTFAGVQVVPTAGAIEPLLYDRDRTLLIVRSDYEALLSEDYGPAYERFAVALRLVARMAAAAPAPVMSMRRLEITGPDAARSEPVRRHAAKTA
jgi:HK97 family phage major capsid protein